MKRVYSALPNVQVLPLHIAEKDLTGDRLLAMMKIDNDNSKPCWSLSPSCPFKRNLRRLELPLYMELVMALRRSMENPSYAEFRKKLENLDLEPRQQKALNQRLSLLDYCLHGGNRSNTVTRHFQPGKLVIVEYVWLTCSIDLEN